MTESESTFVDLHTHSTASDGSRTPRDVVRAARELGLAALALTDHDTVDGLAEASEAGRALGIRIVPGVELEKMGFAVRKSDRTLLQELNKQLKATASARDGVLSKSIPGWNQ